jgi:hypothetical protein
VEEKGKFELQIEKWEKTRKLAKWKYSLIYGSLLWGGSIGIILTVFDIIRADIEISYIIFRFFFFLGVGFLVGKMQWKSREEFYQRYKDL